MDRFSWFLEAVILLRSICIAFGKWRFYFDCFVLDTNWIGPRLLVPWTVWAFRFILGSYQISNSFFLRSQLLYSCFLKHQYKKPLFRLFSTNSIFKVSFQAYKRYLVLLEPLIFRYSKHWVINKTHRSTMIHEAWMKALVYSMIPWHLYILRSWSIWNSC